MPFDAVTTSSRLHTWLTLGRSSNLPTVWTNIVAAACITQMNSSTLATHSMIWFSLFIGLSLMYTGGMFLNDAMDASWDRQHHQLRPIITGEVSHRAVWLAAVFTLPAGALITLLPMSARADSAIMTGWPVLFLLLSIIAYNTLHKVFTHSAWLMGACRFGVYLVTGIAFGSHYLPLLLAGLSLMAYIVAITYIARAEHNNALLYQWPLMLLYLPMLSATYIHYQQGQLSPWFGLYLVGFCAIITRRIIALRRAHGANIKAAVGALLAAIPLVDGLMLASINAHWLCLLCIGIFLLLPVLQRHIRPT